MKISFANDHAALHQRQALIDKIRALGHEVVDYGSDSKEACDYPDFGRKAAEAVARGEADRAILACGTGIGIALAANKVRGIRCAVATDRYGARMSRAHNDANALALRGRLQPLTENLAIIEAWLGTEFEGGRHARRVEKIMQIERETK